MDRLPLNSQPWSQALKLLISPQATRKLLHLVWLEAQAFLLMEVWHLWRDILHLTNHERKPQHSVWFPEHGNPRVFRGNTILCSLFATAMLLPPITHAMSCCVLLRLQ